MVLVDDWMLFFVVLKVNVSVVLFVVVMMFVRLNLLMIDLVFVVI